MNKPLAQLIPTSVLILTPETQKYIDAKVKANIITAIYPLMLKKAILSFEKSRGDTKLFS
jgi:hypothetical protein